MSKTNFFVVRAGLRTLTAVLVCLGCTLPAHGLQPHQQIQGPFGTAGAVAAACLACHPQQAAEMLNSTHWTWTRTATVNGETVLYGKKDSLARFAIDAASNPSRCLGCHISNDPGGMDADIPAPDMVDCLVCHDRTGAYRQTGSPASPSQRAADLAIIARNVGTPTQGNCTLCHFADCGLAPADAAGTAPTFAADVHLSPSGGDFTCQKCHVPAGGHSFTRKPAPTGDSPSAGRGCAACHAEAPHDLDILNKHGDSITCQACHIPAAGRQRPVLFEWNWIMAGKTMLLHQNRPGARFRLHDRNGVRTVTDMEPVYLWDDGGDAVYTRGQRIQPGELTVLQGPAAKSSHSRIAPFRVIYGVQLYDGKYRYLISPLLHPEGPDLFGSGGPDSVAGEGMKALVLPYSGQYAYTATAIYKRISHGVAPAGQALDCLDCHGRTGRMNWAELGFDADPWPNGWGMKATEEESGSAGPATGPEELPPVGGPEDPAAPGL